jgi:cytochrome c oxidase cbb3-type subunit IV
VSASTFLSSVMTVVSFVTFIGIVFWAYSRKRKQAFDEAANAPFALPDDGAPPAVASGKTRAEHRS